MRKLTCLCFIVSLGILCPAQNTSDAGLWTTLSLQKKLTKKINLAVDQEFRLRENFQRLNLFYTNIGIDYKLTRSIKLSPSYRAIQKKRLEPGFSYRHRLQMDVTFKRKLDKITLSERVRYQIEVQDYFTSKKGKLPEQYLRFKTDLKYTNHDKITPYYSCEFRYQITAPRGDDPLYNYRFHRVRNIAGIEYKLNDEHSLNLYYLIQSEFDISNKETTYIVGLAYNINI